MTPETEIFLLEMPKLKLYQLALAKKWDPFRKWFESNPVIKGEVINIMEEEVVDTLPNHDLVPGSFDSVDSFDFNHRPSTAERPDSVESERRPRTAESEMSSRPSSVESDGKMKFNLKSLMKNSCYFQVYHVVTE